MAEKRPNHFLISGQGFTDEDRNLIKSAFKGNEKLLKTLRKFFIPQVDSDQAGDLIDFYSPIPFDVLPQEECKSHGLARNMMLVHLNRVFGLIYTIAETEPKTKEEIEEANKKDSTR